MHPSVKHTQTAYDAAYVRAQSTSVTINIFPSWAQMLCLMKREVASHNYASILIPWINSMTDYSTLSFAPFCEANFSFTILFSPRGKLWIEPLLLTLKGCKQ